MGGIVLKIFVCLQKALKQTAAPAIWRAAVSAAKMRTAQPPGRRLCVIHQPMLFRSCGRMAGRGALVATAVRNDGARVVEFDSNR